MIINNNAIKQSPNPKGTGYQNNYLKKIKKFWSFSLYLNSTTKNIPKDFNSNDAINAIFMEDS